MGQRPEEVVVAVDPGVVKGALAVFVGGDLVHAATIQGHSPHALAEGLVWSAQAHIADVDVASVTWIVEKMVKRKNQDAKYKDLAAVERSVGLLRGLVRSSKAVRGPLKRIKPEQWKGQVPKPVCERRIRAELDEEELSRLVDEGHDTFDAIGIGLYQVDRLRRGMV